MEKYGERLDIILLIQNVYYIFIEKRLYNIKNFKRKIEIKNGGLI